MCMAVSGRCLISDYLAGRSGNKGKLHAAVPVALPHGIPGGGGSTARASGLPLEEDDRGAYLFNARDMNMLAHLDDLRAAGVDSLKIEGRNKKAFYVATVVNAYRQVLDGADPAAFAPRARGHLAPPVLHRVLTTGRGQQAPQQDGYLQGCLHAATVEACEPAESGGGAAPAGAAERPAEGSPAEDRANPGAPAVACLPGHRALPQPLLRGRRARSGLAARADSRARSAGAVPAARGGGRGAPGSRRCRWRTAPWTATSSKRPSSCASTTSCAPARSRRGRSARPPCFRRAKPADAPPAAGRAVYTPQERTKDRRRSGARRQEGQHETDLGRVLFDLPAHLLRDVPAER